MAVKQYDLAKGGWVKFDWEEDVQSVQPSYGDTLVILKSGQHYLLKGRSYGV